jgi:hypothetical protein
LLVWPPDGVLPRSTITNREEEYLLSALMMKKPVLREPMVMLMISAHKVLKILTAGDKAAGSAHRSTNGKSPNKLLVSMHTNPISLSHQLLIDLLDTY